MTEHTRLRADSYLRSDDQGETGAAGQFRAGIYTSGTQATPPGRAECQLQGWKPGETAAGSRAGERAVRRSGVNDRAGSAPKPSVYSPIVIALSPSPIPAERLRRDQRASECEEGGCSVIPCAACHPAHRLSSRAPLVIPSLSRDLTPSPETQSPLTATLTRLHLNDPHSPSPIPLPFVSIRGSSPAAPVPPICGDASRAQKKGPP